MTVCLSITLLQVSFQQSCIFKSVMYRSLMVVHVFEVHVFTLCFLSLFQCSSSVSDKEFQHGLLFPCQFYSVLFSLQQSSIWRVSTDDCGWSGGETTLMGKLENDESVEKYFTELVICKKTEINQHRSRSVSTFAVISWFFSYSFLSVDVPPLHSLSQTCDSSILLPQTV